MKGDVFMAQAMVNFRMDEDLKKSMEQVCKDMGLSMTTAFTIFATRVSKEKRIPFEISADPFYDEFNVQRILAAVANLNAGKGVEHERIEAAWADYLYWQTQDKKTLKRINELIKDIERNGNFGIGKPEPLKGNLSGLWSRRIDEYNRLVYRIREDLLEIVACRDHYGK